jgi:hypothetical protein
MAWAAIVQARCRLAPELAILPAVVIDPKHFRHDLATVEYDPETVAFDPATVAFVLAMAAFDPAMVVFDPAMAE